MHPTPSVVEGLYHSPWNQKYKKLGEIAGAPLRYYEAAVSKKKGVCIELETGKDSPTQGNKPNGLCGLFLSW